MYERIERDEVLDVIKRYGPLLPLEVRRKLGKGDSTMIGAVLSELSFRKKILLTNLKRGGSPFYYDPENPQSLEKVAEHLGEKDKRTYDLLKQEQVVDPATVDPLTRVSLGNIPDYSKAFEHDGKQHYRYYLLSEDDARERLQKPKAQEKKEQKTPAPKKEAPVKTQKKQAQKEPDDEQKEGEEDPAPKKKRRKNDITTQDTFFQEIINYCDDRNITIHNYEIIRKAQELDLTLRVPTALGRVTYYCKAKAKKKSNDGDVSQALLAGQLKRLPTIYLTTGEVTKKAKEMTKRELKGVIIKEV